jgi:hypothetical protein
VLLVMPKAISVPACAGRHAAPARINKAEAITARRFMMSPKVCRWSRLDLGPIAARLRGDLNRGRGH